MNRQLPYTVVMLVDSHEDDFSAYLMRIHTLLVDRGAEHELIVAVNGPGAFVRAHLRLWPTDGPPVRMYELVRKIAAGACLQSLLPECHGETLILCGPYQQIAEESLAVLLDGVERNETDLALPYRQGRVDPLVNQVQSWLFNRLVRRFTRVDLHDLSCSLRVLRRAILDEIVLYGDLYRYLPLLAQKRGFRVREYPAIHVREHGKVGYFGLRVYMNRLADMVSLGFNFGFSRQPLRYFGPRGTVFVALGCLSLALALAFKLLGVQSLGASPWVMIGMAFNLTGSLLWGIGLVAEIMAFALSRTRKDYVVEKMVE